jgi:AraC-like DNA-binding protein
MSNSIPVKGTSFFNRTHFAVVIGEVYAEQDDRPTEADDLSSVEHEHDCPELVIIRGGTALHHYNGTDYPISTGDVFCIHSEQPHFFHQMDRLHLSNVMYNPARLRLPESNLRKIAGYNALFRLEPSYRKQHNFSGRLSLFPKDLARATHLVDQMKEELDGQVPGFEASVLGNLIRLIVFLSRHYGTHPGREASALLRIGKVMGAMESAPHEEWPLEKLAQTGGLSISNLIHTFKMATGLPPIEYLIRLRIRQSMELLTASDMSVTDIAMECGFNDSNYFARQFKRINDMSASEFRKRHLTSIPH